VRSLSGPGVLGRGGIDRLRLCRFWTLKSSLVCARVINSKPKHPTDRTPTTRPQHPRSYALIGLEQTADSTPLPAFPFPRRACLVLGREKEGLPPELLTLMDDCVEIPQFGVVRSLNVHVSAAVALYEYTRQGVLMGGGGGSGDGGVGRPWDGASGGGIDALSEF